MGILDCIGMARYTIIITVMTASMAVFEPLRTFGAQQVYMWLFAIYMGMALNIPGRWPLHFAPPHLYGTCFGLMLAVGGIFGFALDLPLTALGIVGDGPTSVMLVLAALAYAVVSAILVFRGLPKRPPRNRFDTAAYCVSND